VLVIRSGRWELADSWQGWVNSGLMSFFFLVAGLVTRCEFDMGELRERRRLALPVVVALGGMVRPECPGPGAHLHAHVRGRRRRGGHRGHRGRLQRSCQSGRAGRRPGLARPGCRGAPAGRPARPRLPAAGGSGVDRVLRVRRRSGGGRPGDGPARPGLSRHAPRSGGGPSRPFGCSGSSRPRNWPTPRSRACGWRCRRTTGSSSCSIPGPADRTPARNTGTACRAASRSAWLPSSRGVARSEMWFGTQSTMSLMPRRWAPASRSSKSARVPNTGSTSV
jgi:Na+/H+ antiporter 1